MEDLFTIQPVQAWDTDQIAELYRAGGWWKEEYDPSELARLISGSYLFVVAVEKRSGRAVGMGRVISDGVSDAYIQDLVVLPIYRNSGIGRRIVRQLIEQSTEHGISWIGLISEPGNEDFYKSLGFRPMIGHIPLKFGDDV